jgi:hypothetical protein
MLAVKEGDVCAIVDTSLSPFLAGIAGRNFKMDSHLEVCGGAASLIQTPVGMLAHQDAFPLPNRIRGSECGRKNRPASFEMTEWRGGPISENQILRGMRAALGGGLNEVDEVAAGVFEEDGDDGTHARWFAAEAYAELLEAAVFGGDVVG